MRLLLLGFAAGISAVASFGQTTLFSDDFNRATLSGGTYTYTVTAGGDGGASIVSNILVVTNDATAAANTVGRTSVAVALSSFASPFSPTLSANTGTISWSFNLQQVRTDPSGFDTGSSNYGVGFILAGTSNNFGSGSGYAVVLGQSGSLDAVRLVRYSGGIANANLTNLVAPTTVLNDIGAEYVSVRVTYDPLTNNWELFGRNDGATSFTSPASGSLTSLGTATDSTHVGTAMSAMGALWVYSTGANQVARFDNITVTTTAIPEPSTYAAIAATLALAGTIYMRRRKP
jgi:trimeric autotransporter adhesin